MRQLGSIYEGLLEFKLRIAAERMVVLKGKVMPLREAIETGQYKPGKTKAPIYEPDHVYIENDRHERKITGSYYTPDYIVKYIIEQTVDPILQEKFRLLRPQFQNYQHTLRDRQRDNEKLKQMRMPTKELYATYKTYEGLAEELFDIKVLDPAMGSGHFLVDTVDYITDKLIEFLRPLTPNPVHQKLHEIRRDIVEEVEVQKVSIDRSRLTELNLLKRQVLKRCVFGVDNNYMAVILSKMSLWLDTFTQGAPFSFLDYHLKWGNSLLGCNLDVAEKELQQYVHTVELADVLTSAHVTRMLSRGTDSTPKQVKEAQELYAQTLERLHPYKILMNVWMSEYFGNKNAQTVVGTCMEPILKQDYTRVHENDRQVIARAQVIANRKHKNFFHWDLEFPEVFFDENRRKAEGQAGFDAVIGNPPYVRQEGLGEDKGAFKEIYKVYNSIADLYTYFIERGHASLRRGGRFGMITANKFMRANYGVPLRKFLIEQTKLEYLIDFGDLPVFGDATTYPIIVISTNIDNGSHAIECVLIKDLGFDNLSNIVESTASKIPASSFNSTNWSLVNDSIQGILNKLKGSISLPLSEYIEGKIQYGVKTGFNEAFIIDQITRDKLIAEDPKSAEIIKPFLVGEDVRRYTLNFQDRFLIWTYIGVPIKEYPAILKHLQQYQAQLEKRWDKGNFWWELRHCDYYSDFEMPKILYPVIAVTNKFTLDEGGHYTNDKTFFIPIKDLYLLSLLNSSTMFMFFRSELSRLRGGFLEYRAQTLVHTPIRRINFTTSPDQRAYYLEKAKLLYEQCIGNKDQDCVPGFVNHHLTKEPEASDIVHDLLVFLAGEMLRLNKDKQSKQQNFLAWLVDTLKIQLRPDKNGKTGIDALKGKARLTNYAGDYQKGEAELKSGELKSILLDKDNRNRYGVSLSDALLAQIEDCYEQSTAAILPLKTQLERTDRLIDQVVYRLYGLTQEEIDVVELTFRRQVEEKKEFQ